MKRRILAGMTVIAPVAALAFAHPLQAGQEGHGGDPLAAEFVANGWQVLDRLQHQNDLRPDLDDRDLARFKEAIEDTRVDIVDTDLVDHLGAHVEARVITDPLQPGNLMIQLNRAGLLDVLHHGAHITRLALHEYLWVLGKDDTNYRISGRLDLPAKEFRIGSAKAGDRCLE